MLTVIFSCAVSNVRNTVESSPVNITVNILGLLTQTFSCN